MIYLDHAATTPLDPEVLEEMLPYFSDNFYNPSSAYRSSVRIRSTINTCRKELADLIGAREKEIFFTSGGTEGDNLAIKGAARAYAGKGKHLITSRIEHPAVLNAFRELEQEGFRVTYLSVGPDGRVDPDELRKALTEETILVSVMMANNETGVLQPVEEIGRICKEGKALFHTDAVQAFGHVPVDVIKTGCDLLSVSGHKFYGPKGSGFLYVRDGLKLKELMNGGSQERGLRPGTENVPAILGLTAAAKKAVTGMDVRSDAERELSDLLKEELLKIPGSHLNGDPVHKLPGTLNFSFSGIEGSSLLIRLDMAGICVSTGSACTSQESGPSHVLKAMGLSDEEANSCIRFSIGHENTREEILETVGVLKRNIEELRNMRI